MPFPHLQADRDDFDGFDASDQRVAADMIDVDVEQLAGLATIAVKHDDSIAMRSAVLDFLQQAIAQRVTFPDARQQLVELAQKIDETKQRLSSENRRKQAAAPAA